jgi:hypothetical protein
MMIEYRQKPQGIQNSSYSKFRATLRFLEARDGLRPSDEKPMCVDYEDFMNATGADGRRCSTVQMSRFQSIVDNAAPVKPAKRLLQDNGHVQKTTKTQFGTQYKFETVRGSREAHRMNTLPAPRGLREDAHRPTYGDYRTPVATGKRRK